LNGARFALRLTFFIKSIESREQFEYDGFRKK